MLWQEETGKGLEWFIYLFIYFAREIGYKFLKQKILEKEVVSQNLKPTKSTINLSS